MPMGIFFYSKINFSVFSIYKASSEKKSPWASSEEKSPWASFSIPKYFSVFKYFYRASSEKKSPWASSEKKSAWASLEEKSQCTVGTLSLAGT